MIDLSTTNCRQMQERYYAALLDWEKLRYLNRERKAKTAEELEKLKEKIEKRKTHSLRVLAFCSDITKALAAGGEAQAAESPSLPKLNEPLLSAAALLHDIAKFDSNEHHHRLAVSAVKTVCGPYGPEDSSAFFALDEIITAHKGDFRPCPEYAAEAAILRMADKLDKIHRRVRKVQQAELTLKRTQLSLERAQSQDKSAKKLEKKADNVLKWEQKLEERRAELNRSSQEFRKNWGAICAYAQGGAPGSCGPDFIAALKQALKSLYKPSSVK